jgi:hypothetical protein
MPKVNNDSLIASVPENAMTIDCTDKDASELVVEGHAKGPLLRALESNKPIVLKNFSKVRPDTDVALGSILQFLAGEIDEVAIYDPKAPKGSLPLARYKKSDIGQNFSLSVIASDTSQLKPSLESRLHTGRVRIVPGGPTA